MPQQPYNLGPANTPGFDSHFATHTKHIANIADHETRLAAREAAGGVSSVNGEDGVVVLDAADIDETAARKWFSQTERDKLVGIATNATANSSDAFLRSRDNHTGSQLASTISDLTEAVQDIVGAYFTGAGGATVTYDDTAGTLTITASGGGSTDPEAIRDTIGAALVGVGLISITVNDALDTITISTTATANSSDSSLRDRGTHTGSQAANTISDFAEAAEDAIGAMVVRSGGTYDDAAGTFTMPGGGGGGGTPYAAQVSLAPSGGIISTDASLSQNFAVAALTAATTLANPTNLVAGMTLTWRFLQGTGGTLACGSLFKFPFGIPPAMTAANGAVDMLVSYYDGTSLISSYTEDYR